MQAIRLVFDNLKYVMIFLLFLSLLAISGSLTNTIRAAKEGLKQIMTPLGLFVLIILGIIVFIIYQNLKGLVVT